MASDAQMAANKRNAALSTGPGAHLEKAVQPATPSNTV
jgi:hypothetical protein